MLERQRSEFMKILWAGLPQAELSRVTPCPASADIVGGTPFPDKVGSCNFGQSSVFAFTLLRVALSGSVTESKMHDRDSAVQ